MISNELLFLIATLVEVIAVFLMARLGREWLLGSVAVNLILIAILGSKLISVFGFTTNVGNVFYACVFLATHFFIERYGKNTANQVVWFGVIFVIFFTLMSQIAVHYDGLPLSDGVNNASKLLFSISWRTIIASVLAYIFAQHANILIFSWIHKKTNGKFLWLRSNGANIISQLLDSMLFFSIAFFDLSGLLILQAILAGWVLKSLVGLLGTPLLYLNAYLDQGKL